MLILSLVIALAPSQANAWCDKDCSALCRAVAGRGYAGTVETCLSQYRCEQYAGRQCEPANVQLRAQRLNAGSGRGAQGTGNALYDKCRELSFTYYPQGSRGFATVRERNANIQCCVNHGGKAC